MVLNGSHNNRNLLKLVMSQVFYCIRRFSNLIKIRTWFLTYWHSIECPYELRDMTNWENKYIKATVHGWSNQYSPAQVLQIPPFLSFVPLRSVWENQSSPKKSHQISPAHCSAHKRTKRTQWWAWGPFFKKPFSSTENFLLKVEHRFTLNWNLMYYLFTL